MLIDDTSIKLVDAKLDYEYVVFKCGAWFEYGHLATTPKEKNGIKKELQTFGEKYKEVKPLTYVVERHGKEPSFYREKFI